MKLRLEVDEPKGIVHRTVMLELTSKDKAQLRNAAQRLKPSVFVGKSGVSEGVVRELNIAFKDDELIKVAFKAERDDLKALVEQVENETKSVCVGGVGKKRSFYRKMPEESVALGDDGN